MQGCCTCRASGQNTPLRPRCALMASRICSAMRGATTRISSAQPTSASASAMSPSAMNPGPRLAGVLHRTPQGSRFDSNPDPDRDVVIARGIISGKQHALRALPCLPYWQETLT